MMTIYNNLQSPPISTNPAQNAKKPPIFPLFSPFSYFPKIGENGESLAIYSFAGVIFPFSPFS